MRKTVYLVMAVMFAITLMLPVAALAGAPASTTNPDGTPFDWGYLATVGGAAAFALVVVQFIKAPLDKIWRVPTRAVVYVLCVVGMTAGTYFTSEFTLGSIMIIPINSIVAAFAAMGAYDVTFKKLE